MKANAFFNMVSRLKCRFPVCVLIAAASLASSAPNPAPGEAARILRQIGVTNGICALPGDLEAATGIQLARQTELIVYIQLTKEADVQKARQKAAEAGLLGTRIYVVKGNYDRLHLADNVADALVALGPAANLPESEALRVVQPNGKVLRGNQTVTKPFPKGVDDWSHPYHRPDNNPVSDDKVAHGPYLTQFLGDPRYAPLPQVAVASGGRIFKAFGHIAFKEREEPWLNTLAAFNGYNGTLLWRREIPPALMVHRSTIVATPTRLYFGDDKSCKVYDAANGSLIEEIAPPANETGGTFWKWMALEGNVLYALIGEQEKRDPVIRAKSKNHGWPWNPLSPGFNEKDNTWGYGKTLVAIDVNTKKILWRYQEDEPIDSRALCMKNGRLYAFSFGHYLSCIETATGSTIWRHTRESDPALFNELGNDLDRQDWRTNWRTTALLRCSDQALYFAGPAIHKLVAVSAETGKVLWSHPYSNYQLILHNNELYGISGQIDNEISRKFDPLTGKILAELKINRRACTRPTASDDAIFFRAGEGSIRVDMAKDEAQLVSPMRPNCHDGVTVANGLLYWWPSVCDCNLTLYGITCLGPAGDFNFGQPAIESERLEVSANANVSATLAVVEADWPTFRKDNQGSVKSPASIAQQASKLWEYAAPAPITPTAPTAAGNLVFFAGADGILRALDSGTGKPAWQAFTAGEVRLPPTIAGGRAFAGSADGWVYAVEASTGRQLWRFRAAPTERVIPVYGTLSSTWPAASGVLVDNDVAYVAAGLANYDGTHVYALKADTGRVKWQNNESGHLDKEGHTGVGVQGHMLIRDGRLYLAGGNAVSPAMYDLGTGNCLNDLNISHGPKGGYLIGSLSPRGWELYVAGNRVMVAGKPYYSHPEYPVFDAQVLNKSLYVTAGDLEVAWINNTKLACFGNLGEKRVSFQAQQWGKTEFKDQKPQWQLNFKDSSALAVAANAVVIATPAEVTALNLQDGSVLWKHALPAPPVPWGLAINRDGKVILTLEGGRVICFG